jgi:hypothetical protein
VVLHSPTFTGEILDARWQRERDRVKALEDLVAEWRQRAVNSQRMGTLRYEAQARCWAACADELEEAIRGV